MIRRFLWGSLCVLLLSVAAFLALVPKAHATLPAEAQLPIGIPIVLTFRADAGAGSTAGVLVAFDEQWIVIRDEKGLMHWFQTASIRNVDSGPAPAAAPAPAPAPAPEPAPAAPAPAPAPAAPAQ
jgi:hypothetical protein